MQFNHKNRTGLLLFLLLIIPLMGFSQGRNCAVNLREAQSQFDMGQIEKVPGLLMDCIESGFTRDEKIQAYKLLINSFIYDDNLALAEQYILAFLKNYPEYEVVATDPSEFVNLLNEFNNDPRSSIGIGGGLNISNVRVIEDFGPDALTGLGEGLRGPGVYRSSGFGFQAGMVYNINLTSNLEIGLEPMIIQDIYEYEFRPFDFTHVEYSEDQLRVDLPVTVIYRFDTDLGFDPYLRAGFKTSYLLSAKSDSKRSYLETGSVDLTDVKIPEEEIPDKRMLNNYWAVIGGGIRYKIPSAYIFLDVRYNLGLLNQVNEESRNNGLDENFFLYYYLQDDFYLDDFSISIGIAKTLYRPKRK